MVVGFWVKILSGGRIHLSTLSLQYFINTSTVLTIGYFPLTFVTVKGSRKSEGLYHTRIM